MRVRLAHRLVLTLGALVLISAVVMGVLIPRSVNVEFEQFVEKQELDAAVAAEDGGLLQAVGALYSQHGRSVLASAQLPMDRRLLVIFESKAHWSNADRPLTKVGYEASTDTLSFSLVGEDENVLMLAGIPPQRWLNSEEGVALAWMLPSDVFSPPALQFERSVRLRTYLVIVPVVLTILALMYWLVRRSMAPVERLNLAMRGIGDGSLPDRLEVQSNDEVGELTASFNEAIDRLQRMQQARHRMTSDIAHELRTPITNVRARLEGMVDGVFAVNQDEARILLAEMEQLSTLVEDLQQLSLAESGELSVALQPVRLVAFIADLEQTWKPVAESAGKVIGVAAEEALEVQADPVRLRQLIGILIDNALQHGGPGVTVTLRCRRHHGQPELVVEDNGPGMGEADRNRMFDRLYRADESRARDTGGSGLGLAIARQLAALQGAVIESQSGNQSMGLRMIVRFQTWQRRESAR